MAKGRKGRTFRKKMKGGQEEEEEEEKKEYSFLPIDISKIRGQALAKPVSLLNPSEENISDYNIYADDTRGGKLRRTRKRRMSKRTRNSRKSRKSKSRKMRRGGLSPNFLTANELRNEYNSGFENQPVEEEINRIKERNDKTVYDNITELSPEFIKKNGRKHEKI